MMFNFHINYPKVNYPKGEVYVKIWVITKRNGILFVCLAVLLTAAVLFGRNEAVTVAGTKRDLPVYCVDTGGEKIVSVSFDAAWGNEDTQTLIDILAKYNIKATFFVVGGWVDSFPDSVRALSEAGHEIMNHSDTHPYMTKISTEEIKKEVEECSKKIESVTGKKPTLLRAPYGDYNNTVVKTVRECGCMTVQWSVDSLDWKDLSASEIKKRVTERIHPGAIVLFHNAALHTPEALPGIIEALQNDGYVFVPISELVYTDNYGIDAAGKQYKLSE